MDRSLGECAIGDAAWAARILDFPVDYLAHLHDRADGIDAEFLRSAMVDIVDSREDISWLFADNVPLLLLSPPNALNTVVASLEAGSPARDMVKNLADYLRFSLHEARPLEPLSRELDALEWYFELQRVRFQDGLECRIASSPAAMRVLVPPMLVQPLLENAFKYGPMSSPRPLRVNVEAIVVAGWLEIRVTNSGGWVPPGSVDSHGSGLANIRRRLSLILGVEDALRVEEGAESVSVTIRIPASSPLP